jgi:hypothetical protein
LLASLLLKIAVPSTICNNFFFSLSFFNRANKLFYLKILLEQSVAYDRSSAPKDCRVSGWLQGNNMDVALDTEKMFLLSEFTYDFEKSNAQTFNVLDLTGSGIVDTVRLDFNVLFHMYDSIFVSYFLNMGLECYRINT